MSIEMLRSQAAILMYISRESNPILTQDTTLLARNGGVCFFVAHAVVFSHPQEEFFEEDFIFLYIVGIVCYTFCPIAICSS